MLEKRSSEQPPQLYDLTSLQVDCNRKFGFSADTTLKNLQSLYEKKLTSYPRVDTRFLTDDIYPKCPGRMFVLEHDLWWVANCRRASECSTTVR